MRRSNYTGEVQAVLKGGEEYKKLANLH